MKISTRTDPPYGSLHATKPVWPKWLAFGVAIIATLSMVYGPQHPKSMAAKYPGPWIDRSNLDISRALVKIGARDCGEYVYRPAADFQTEYLVYCTSTGNTWSSYLVWTSSGDVIGPSKTSPDIPPPH